MPQITIVILQYRPDAAALRRTLASLAMQDTRDFAVVLGDDGSAQDYFAESRAYLAAHGITDGQLHRSRRRRRTRTGRSAGHIG